MNFVWRANGLPCVMTKTAVGSRNVWTFEPGSKRCSGKLICWNAWMNPRRWRLTKTIDVEIYGQRYSVNGEADESYVKKLAEMVDTQMKQVAAGMRSATPAKLAVLAAFNLAHELLESERRFRQDEADADRRVASLMESIEQQMPSILSR
ncbi:MAG: cell division protein ZapA [Nitrospira sp. CR1.2]|nr:cell division protein ZapA [Nitrospira sp. CR1.2]